MKNKTEYLSGQHVNPKEIRLDIHWVETMSSDVVFWLNRDGVYRTEALIPIKLPNPAIILHQHFH